MNKSPDTIDNAVQADTPDSPSSTPEGLATTIASFLLFTGWIPVVTAFALLLANQGDDANWKSIVQRICLASLFFVGPALAVRFLLARRALRFFPALLCAALFWFSFSLMYRAFSVEAATLDMAADLPVNVLSIVPVAGPLLCLPALFQEVELKTQKAGSPYYWGSVSSTARAPHPAIGLMFATSLAMLRWRRPVKIA